MKYDRRALFASMIAILVLLAACNPVLQSPGGPTLAGEATPGEALQADAAEYARQFGVSQEEAVRRLSLQDDIGELNAALEREEAETFAGLWIQHEPEYGVVVAFTGDGERTIRPYLAGKPYADLVQVETFPHSLQELQAAQQQASQIAVALDIPITSYITVQENKVVLEVGNPELFLGEVRAAGRELPDLVEVAAMDLGSLPGDLRGGVELYTGPSGETVYFPRQAPTNVFMQALFQGTLVLDANGCLRVEGEGVVPGSGHLVLWRYDFSLKVARETVEVLNGEGQVVARVGEAVSMGGGEIPSVDIPGFPGETCPGPYWALGDIQPLETN